MKYKVFMKICCKNEDEIFTDTETPATIRIDCDYNKDGFCVYSEDCDFSDVLSEIEVKELNEEK